MPIVYDPTSFMGVVYNRTPFDVSFGSTFSNYTKTIQFTDSSPAVLAATSNNQFVSTVGYTGTGNVGTMIVDAISTNPRTVTTYAGTGAAGFVDGLASNARFNYPMGMVTDVNGTTYIADSLNCMIRTIDSNGIVARYAGTGGYGIVDGNRFSAAFQQPFDIDRGSNGALYIADTTTIRKIYSDIVSTITPIYPVIYGEPTLFTPLLYGITVDPNSNVYVVDSNNNKIIKLDSVGNASTILTGPGSSDGTLSYTGTITLTNPFGVGGGDGLTLITSNLSRLLEPKTSPGFMLNHMIRDSTWWIAATNGAYPIYRTTDSDFPNWSSVIVYGDTLANGWSVATDGAGIYVVTGNPTVGGTTSILYSGDGVNWGSPSVTNTANIMIGFEIAYGANRFIATGTPGSGSLMYSSPSGLNTWTAVDGTALGEGQTIATDGNSNWIAAGDTDARISTNNGTSWSSLTGLLSVFPTPFAIKKISYGNSVWIAVGSNIIARSTNRTSWTSIPQNAIDNIYSVVYNSNTSTWLARGLNFGTTPAYAKSVNNGLTWTSVTNLTETTPVSLERRLVSISATVNVSGTVAGSATTTGPFAIRSDASGVVYFGDASHKVRMISNGMVSTYAGTGSVGSNDGARLSATFGNIVDIRFDPTDGSMFVLENNPSRVRKISNGVVSTYAGTGAYASTNGDALAEAAFANVQKLSVTTSNILVAESGCNKIRSVNPPVASARPGGTVPSGYTIVDTATFPITVANRIDSSTNNGDILQLYKYEPFSYGYKLQSGVSAGDTLSYSGSSTELIQFLSNVDSRTISFASAAGPTFSSSNALSLLITDLSSSISMETVSNTVYINPGRFFPPAANSVYTFYRNEPIDPVLFQATIPLSNPVSFPALPQGLSFTRSASNAFYLTGTPLIQQLSSNYRILGNGLSNSAQVVSVLTNIRIAGERLVMDASGSTTIQGVTLDTSISPVLVTSRCPPYPVLASNVKYTWTPALPDGITFADKNGVPVSSGFVVTDLSYSIQLQGAPTSTALQTTSSPYTVTLTATRQTTPAISNSIPFTFAFQETVVFDPYLITPQYVGATVQSSSTSNSFSAQTKFSSVSVPITSIFSPDLRSDLSLSFVYATQRASLTGTPSSAGSGTYTIRAVNANNVSTDTTATINVSNDQVFFSVPTTDICYNFIVQRPLSSAKTGYYSAPIQFKASTLSGCNVTMSTGDLTGTGISLVQTNTNTYDLSGVPTTAVGLTTLTVTASSPATVVSNTATARYAILADTYTFNNPTLAFAQNVAITPVQFVATALSGRTVVRYTSPDVPAGLTLSPTGILTGTPLVNSSGSFTVVATTVYTSDSHVYSYTIVPDTVLLFTERTSYTTAAGDSVSIPVHSVSYSGSPVGLFDLSGLSTSYGLSIDSTGLISGTVSTSIPPSTAFSVVGYAGSAAGTLAASLVSANPYVSSTLTFASPFSGGPIVTSPAQTSFVYYQYMTINPITVSATGTGTVYVMLNSADLPLGLSWNPLTQKITGSPMRTGETDVIVYLRDDTGVRKLTLHFSVLIPRIIRQQDGAGAFTSLLRQYVEVNAAQNARDSRVFPNQERALGEFMAPEAPDVSSSVICKNF